MKSIFSNLPNTLIMKIIREATESYNLDYHIRNIPKDYIMNYARLCLFLKDNSESVNKYPVWTNPNVSILLPDFMRGSDYPDDSIPQQWCNTYSSLLLEKTMSDKYLELVYSDN
jgi:hypothetical protein